MRLSSVHLGAGLGLLSLMSSGAGAAGTETLQPVKAWSLDYSPTQCAELRDYGDPTKPVILGIIPAPNGESYELVLVYRSPHPDGIEEVHGSVDFGSGPISALVLRYGSKDGKLTLYRYRISAAEMQQARSAKAVALQSAYMDTSFELDQASEVLEGLQRCTADLMRYWNYDGEKQGSIAVPSKGDVRSIFSSFDYPRDAAAKGEQGTTQYLLLVDEKGRVAGCHVLIATGIPTLDSRGCIVLLARARFTPARDASGKPVRSAVVTPEIVWRIP
jgi:TonB family protein